jgi:hypothetical protein
MLGPRVARRKAEVVPFLKFWSFEIRIGRATDCPILRAPCEVT